MLIRANDRSRNFNCNRYSLQQEGNIEFIYDEFEDSVLLESVSTIVLDTITDAALYIERLEYEYIMFVWECKNYVED